MDTETSPELASLSLLPNDDEELDDGASRTMGGRVYVSIRQAILRGKLEVGTPLSEEAVAAQLGVSRTPVKKALLNLEHEGLLEPGPRRMLLVREPTPALCDEVLTMRVALESEAVSRACQVGSDDDLDRIKITVFRQERECRRRDAGAFIEADGEFHFAIAEAAMLPLFHKTLVQLHAFTRLIGLKALRKPGRMEQVLQEHEAIVEGIEQRDPAMARAAMRKHLESTALVLDIPRLDIGQAGAANGEKGKR
jgi:DNA-binding GntR family transcriptional regulator